MTRADKISDHESELPANDTAVKPPNVFSSPHPKSWSLSNPPSPALENGEQASAHRILPLPSFEPDAQLRDPGEAARLCLSENNIGCSSQALNAARAELANLHRYPDASAGALVRAVAKHTGLPEESVVVGNGIDELLLFVALAFLAGG